jgi:hypothetical protein
MGCERAGGGDPLAERREMHRVLQRIAGRDDPPDPVELEALHGQKARGEVRLVRRVEGAAEQADPHSGRVRRQDALRRCEFLTVHGRI